MNADVASVVGTFGEPRLWRWRYALGLAIFTSTLALTALMHAERQTGFPVCGAQPGSSSCYLSCFAYSCLIVGLIALAARIASYACDELRHV
jgi:hypothetical protein